MKEKYSNYSDDVILSKIRFIRGIKVMIDMDLSTLYNVQTKRLNEQVRRNIQRFPTDFMFQINQSEKTALIESDAELNNLKFSPNLPYAFTEHGAVMLASVLNSPRAIEVNIQIVRIFSQIRTLILGHKDILLKLEQLENKVIQHDDQIKALFSYLKQMLNTENKPRPRIGFTSNKVN